MKRFVLSISMITVVFTFLITGCKRNADDVVELSSINVTGPDKTDYLVGEELDRDGLFVEAVYSDETTKDVTELAVLSGFDKDKEGTQTVTVSYTEDEITKTDEFTVTVSVQKIKITFDANGGSGTMDAQLIEKGKETSLAENKFKKQGYTFVGWATKKDSASAEVADKGNYSGTADVTLYAIWAPGNLTHYKVEHYQQNVGNNEYTLKDSEVLTGKTDAQTAAAAKTYTGFTSKEFKQTKIAADESSVVKIYYDRNTITLTFDLKGGKGTAELKGKYGAVIEKITAPIKEGSEFGGWNSPIPSTFEENKNYTALWGCYVNFDKTTGNGTMNRQFFEEGVEQPLTANTFTRQGYDFAGWATKAEATEPEVEDKGKYKSTGNITLYAMWVPGTHTPYKVEHYQQNISDDDYTLKDTENLTGTTLAQTVAAGKTYTGFTRKDFNQAEIAADGSTVVKIYYDRNIITLTLDLDGGTGTDKVEGRYGAAVDKVDAPTKAGEMFKDWNPNLPETFTEDGSYKAIWMPEITVTFVGNGNDLSGIMNKQTLTGGVSGKLSENKYKNFGLFFDGWNTKADGSGTSYTDEQNVTLTADTTLYAQWKAYKVLPETETGTQGTNKRYVLMGMWPQTVAASTVNVDKSKTKTLGMYTYYQGDDGEWYAEQAGYGDTSNSKYSDGSFVGINGNDTRYFKVEPIKWCVLTDSYAYSDGKKASLLLAESILTANVPYYENNKNDRTIGDNSVYSNNYEHSQIRAFLNGLSYTGESGTVTTYNDGTTAKGFLQTAFIIDSVILETQVDNRAESTTDAANKLSKADGTSYGCKDDFTCGITTDKIFLLSEREVTTADYGFEDKGTNGEGNSRIREAVDFAKANYVNYSETTGFGGYWYLRSPQYDKEAKVRYVSKNGKPDDSQNVTSESCGIVPALCINLQ